MLATTDGAGGEGDGLNVWFQDEPHAGETPHDTEHGAPESVVIFIGTAGGNHTGATPAVI